MIRTFVLALFALNVLASCASHGNQPYRPITKPERIEFARDRLDVYPDDVRKNLDAYTNAPVVWTGVILSTDAHEEDTGNTIMADTVFEHHYFDWVQDGSGRHARLSLSDRGEGLFRTRWRMNRSDIDASAETAENYAARGKLAVVYGTPEKVDADGTVILKYRYLRLVDQDRFTTNQLDYGRLGEPLTVLHPKGH